MLADLNHDGKADLFFGDRVAWNRHTLLEAPRLAALDTSWSLGLETWRLGAAVQVAWFAVGSQETHVVIPGVGTLFVDPNGAGIVPVPVVAGSVSIALAIPADPLLLGLPLFAQAIAFDGQRLQLSSVVRDAVR